MGDGVGVAGAAEAKDEGGGGDVDVDNMCADAATQFRLIPIWPIAIYSSQERCTTDVAICLCTILFWGGVLLHYLLIILEYVIWTVV